MQGVQKEEGEAGEAQEVTKAFQEVGDNGCFPLSFYIVRLRDEYKEQGEGGHSGGDDIDEECFPALRFKCNGHQLSQVS